jgi:hypothetical protein
MEWYLVKYRDNFNCLIMLGVLKSVTIFRAEISGSSRIIRGQF